MGIYVIDQHMSGINFAIEFCCAIFTIVVLIALLIRKKFNPEIRAFIIFCFCSASAMWTDIICYMCAGNSKFIGLMYAMTVISYTFTVFASCMFLMYIIAYFEERAKIKYKHAFRMAIYIYSIVCSLVYASSIWNHWFFFVDENCTYHATENSGISGDILLPIVVASIIIIIANRKHTSKRDTVLHLMYLAANIILGFIDVRYTVSFHYIAMTILVLLIFVFIGLERDKQLEIKNKDLAISELNALRLQMNPHFVYNTLASIDGLVDVDPDEARQLIAKFTKHLRSSYLDNSPSFVPFEKELENIKCYLAVEEVRFPDIEIKYNLTVMDFNIPPLTIQPIIENAIKHGICKKDDSAGTITISTYDDEKNNYIEITDNGVGFNSKKKKEKDGRTHLGIDNSRKRLELICNGSLDIVSIQSVGTQVLVTVPKEKT